LSAYELCQKKSTNIDPNFHDSSATELRATQSHVTTLMSIQKSCCQKE
jgi:hypothetical protein